MSIAQLGYEIDSSQAVDAERNLDRMGEAAGRAGNDAQGLEKQSSGLASTLKRLAPLAAGLAASLAGMFSARAVIGAAEQYENRMARVNAVIQATGGVAGRTAEQLEANAQALARATLESVDGVMQAQQTLLTFRNVQGEVFDRAIESAADLSAAMGQDLTSSTRQLARALEDPIQGVTALTRSGTVFTQQQRDMIRTLVESGDMLGAQNLILEELEGQYGGVAQAGAGLREAKDELSRSLTNLLIGLNDTFRINERLTNTYNAAADAVQWLADNVDSLRGYVISASIAITAYYIPALIRVIPLTASWVATNAALAASFVTLRGAILAMGIGAFVVLAGMAINYLLRLREATGSWGDAFGLIKDVFDEVVGRIRIGLDLLGEVFEGAAMIAEGAFTAAFDVVSDAFVTYVLRPITQGLNTLIRGANSLGASFSEIDLPDAGGSGEGSNRMGLGRELVSSAGGAISDLFSESLESIDAIRKAMEETEGQFEDNSEAIVNAVNNINNAIAGGGSGGGGSSGDDAGLLSRFEALQDELRTQAEQVEIWYQEAQETLQWALENERITLEDHAQMKLEIERLYQEQLAAIRAESNAQQLGEMSYFFDGMAQLAQAGGDRMARIARVFGAIQATINSYVAATAAMAETPGSMWVRLGAYAKVLATGLGAVAAIRGGGSSGGGGSSQPRAEGVTQQQTPLRRTIVELRGPDWVKGIVQPVMEQIYEASEDGQVVFAR